RVEYAVEKDSSGAWNVKEVAHTPWVEEKPAAAPLAVETIELAEQGRTSLRSGRTTKDAIHGVMEFEVTSAGEVQPLRRGGGGGASFGGLGREGRLVLERDLAPVLPSKDDWPESYTLAGDRRLLQFSEEHPWLLLDVRTGETKPAPLPAGGVGTQVAAFDD